MQREGNIRLTHAMGRATASSQNSSSDKGESASYGVEPSDFQRVRLQQPAPQDLGHWYCRNCRCIATMCTGISYVHDLVSLSFDVAAITKEEIEARERLQLQANEQEADSNSDILNWRKAWGNDEFFESFSVEWSPLKPVIDLASIHA